jgi:hypothetical protein
MSTSSYAIVFSTCSPYANILSIFPFPHLFSLSASLHILSILQQPNSPLLSSSFAIPSSQQMGIHLHVATVGESPTKHRPEH